MQKSYAMNIFVLPQVTSHLIFIPLQTQKYFYIMSCIRVLFCLIFPPLAVFDQGCGSIVITTILTICGWVPGCIAALIILNGKK